MNVIAAIQLCLKKRKLMWKRENQKLPIFIGEKFVKNFHENSAIQVFATVFNCEWFSLLGDPF